MRSKSNKNQCEICGHKDKKALDFHHILPRVDSRSHHGISNLAIVCANCHRSIHAGAVILEGVFATTGGTKLFWHRAGEPYIIRPGIFLQEDGTAKIVEA